MSDCIFCKIVRREIPAHVVYEDDDFLALLDIHPHGPGHTQIIPKKHFRWVWDVPAEQIGKYFQVAQKIALAQKKAFGVDLARSQVYGNEVPHAHIWVWTEAGDDETDLKKNAEKIKDALAY